MIGHRIARAVVCLPSPDFPITDNAVQTDYQGKSDAFIVNLMPRE
jgi:hypothetical protein